VTAARDADRIRAAQALRFTDADAAHFAWQVTGPGGRLFVIEPNGANPLIAAQACVMPAETALRRSRREALEPLLAAERLRDIRVEMRQPLPLRRLVLHHRFGLPALGRGRWPTSRQASDASCRPGAGPTSSCRR